MLTTRLLIPGETKLIEEISNWYQKEWKIPIEKSISDLNHLLSSDNPYFQMLLFDNNCLISTGGIREKVGLHIHESSYSAHPNWLALMLTKPQYRGQGLGKQLLDSIEDTARERKMNDIFLFTDTAESLYSRNHYHVFNKLTLNDRSITVMKKDLTI